MLAVVAAVVVGLNDNAVAAVQLAMAVVVAEEAAAGVKTVVLPSWCLRLP